MAKQYLDLAGLTTLTTGIKNGSMIAGKAKEDQNGNVIDQTYATKSELETLSGNTVDYIDDSIEALDSTIFVGLDSNERQQIIVGIEERDGKLVAASAATLDAQDITVEKVSATTETIGLTGADVQSNLENLAKAIKQSNQAQKSYKTTPLTAAEIAALTDGANVKEAYKLQVSNNGSAYADVEGAEIIKVYKDKNLKAASFVATDASGNTGNYLKMEYVLANGNDEVVYIDMSQVILEAEVENGIQAVDHKLSVKIDAASETFLSTGADGVKLSGVQSAIDAAQASATTVVSEKTTGHVTVAETMGADGHKIFTISENDIASATAMTAFSAATVAEIETVSGATNTLVATEKANLIGTSAQTKADATIKGTIVSLEAEETRAKGQEDTIEAAIGLAADGAHVTTTGNYTSAATTIVGEIAALDTQLKAKSDQLDKLDGEATVDGSIKKQIATAKSEITGTDADTKDTLTLEGLKKAVADAKSTASAAHTVVNAKADGHVTVAVTTSEAVDGVTHPIVTVSENDIASAALVGATTDTSAQTTVFGTIAKEVARAKTQEDTIEAAIGLNANGAHVAAETNYTATATTIAGEIAALDSVLKTTNDLVGATTNTSAQTTVFGTIAKEVQERKDAVADVIGTKDSIPADSATPTLYGLKKSLANAVEAASDQRTKVDHISGNIHVTVTSTDNGASGVTYHVNETNIASASFVGDLPEKRPISTETAVTSTTVVAYVDEAVKDLDSNIQSIPEASITALFQ